MLSELSHRRRAVERQTCSGPNWVGLVPIEVHADLPGLDIHPGDRMMVDCDVSRVAVDGLHIVELDGSANVYRFQRVPESPTGWCIKIDGDTRWVSVTCAMLESMVVVGRVVRVYRAEIVG